MEDDNLIMERNEHNRRSIRLKGYDYTRPGAYFVTICTQNRACLFWDDHNDKIVLSPMGLIAKRAWLDLPRHYAHAQMDAFCIMPNHVHGIIVLNCDDVSPRRGGSAPAADIGPGQMIDCNRPLPFQPQTRPYSDDTGDRHGLPELVRAFKSFSARRINAARHTPGVPVWQRNYYEHIIRNQDEWQRIRDYILANPENWGVDEDHISNFPQG